MIQVICWSLIGLVLAQEPAEPVRRLPPPPMTAFLPGASAAAATTRLVQVSRKPNAITDIGVWVHRHRLTLPEYQVPGTFGGAGTILEALPEGIPTEYQGRRLIRALRTGKTPDRVLLIYGNDFSDSRLLVAFDRSQGRTDYVRDFSNYLAPTDSPGGAQLEGVVFALEGSDGTLYVANAINGYAREAGGKTAFVTALNPKTGRLLWRSAPRTHNAAYFVLAGDVLICGYGFTAEPDFLYLLDTRTGRKVQTLPVKSGPEQIVRKGDQFYVRCYDTDYLFRMKR